MSNNDFSPGILLFEVENADQNYTVVFKRDKDNYIDIRLRLTGIPYLIGPFDDETRAKFIYIYLVYQNGGRNFEIISSIDTYFPKDALEKDFIEVSARLDVLPNQVYETNFVSTYYYVIVGTRENQIQDENEIDFTATNRENAILFTKIYTSIDE
ncbi:hypothetical protein [Lysinibacillus sp. RC79]|uniref:hypothetical protein n=1 Tax=Lysinibacillus sp. RC79 TaxID=3156296 RepID=UPI003513B578